MKFDYKPKKSKAGSPVIVRALYISLGFIVVVCFTFVLSARHHSVLKTKEAETPQILPLASQDGPSPVSNIQSSSMAVSDETTNSQKQIESEREKAKLLGKAAKQKNQPLSTDKQKESDNLHSVKIRSGDTLAKIFKRLGISKDLHKIMNASPSAKKQLAALKPGKTLQLAIDKNSNLQSLKLDLSPGSTLSVSKMGESFKVEHKEKPLDKQVAFGKGAIHDSLFSSAKRAGLDNNIVNQFIEIFGWNIDFALDLQPKDTFRVLYEDNRLEGERVKTGPILAAEIVNEGKKHIAIRYTDKNGHSAYFSPEGYGMYQAFLRTPVNFTRISSNFGMRNHPILHKLRRHTGVDYSAPVGTPVKSTSDGKVVFIGRRGGYGNVIELQHGARYSTLYGHLSKFAKGLKCGSVINQGQVIGYVGKTGMATGPHLHYEFRIDGIHRDPLTVALPRRSPLSNENKKQFLAHAQKMLRLMDLHENKVGIASVQGMFSNMFLDAYESSQIE